nr:methyltransferase domain-containing protein [Deltaproteobacteria bacterium]
MIDWGDGTYERTAEQLIDATETALERAALRPGERVLDLGCGSGNVALAAARRGGVVTALDPSTRLVAVAEARARAEGFTLRTAVGAAEALPFDGGAFELVLSVFAVIFSDAPERAAAEIVRVLAPGDRAVITAWHPTGAISAAGLLLRQALMELSGRPPRPPPPWNDPAQVVALFAPHGARVTSTDSSLRFEAPSAEAWFAEQQDHHPVWRFAERALSSRPGAWASLRERSIAALEAKQRGVGRVQGDQRVLDLRGAGALGLGESERERVAQHAADHGAGRRAHEGPVPEARAELVGARDHPRRARLVLRRLAQQERLALVDDGAVEEVVGAAEPALHHGAPLLREPGAAAAAARGRARREGGSGPPAGGDERAVAAHREGPSAEHPSREPDAQQRGHAHAQQRL